MKEIFNELGRNMFRRAYRMTYETFWDLYRKLKPKLWEEGTEKWNRLNERKRKIEQTLNTYKAQKSQLESDIQAAASADSASDNAAVRRRRQRSSAPAAS